MSDLREVITKKLDEDLEKVHDEIAKLNDNLRYLRGVDLDDLEEQQFTALLQLIEALSRNVPLISAILDITIVQKLKERA